MERRKAVIFYMFFMFSFFDIFYGDKVKKSSKRLRSDTVNLSFVSIFEKKLENNSNNEYNNKKKKFKTSISSNININKLKIEDKKSPYLYKPYMVLKNGSIKGKSSNIMYIKKNKPYVSNKYISNERKISHLGSIAYSFLQQETPQIIDTKVSNDYKDLIKKLDLSYNKMRDTYAYLRSYEDMRHYFRSKRTENFNHYKSVILPFLFNISSSTRKLFTYIKQSKNDMRKKMNKLEQLIENDKDKSKFTQELDNFKSDIQQITNKLDSDLKTIEQEERKGYNFVKDCLIKEHCKDGNFSSMVSLFNNEFTRIYNIKKYKFTSYINNSKKYEDFLNSDIKLLKIKEKNFYQKKYKHALNLLIEEINDIIVACKDDEKKLSTQIEHIEISKSNLTNVTLNTENMMKNILDAPYFIYNFDEAETSFRNLKKDFDAKKEEIHSLYNKIEEEFHSEINSLNYPNDLESECDKIIRNSQETLDIVDNMIFENCETLENLSYSNTKIFDYKNEISKLYANVAIHSINIKGKFHLINEKCKSVKSEKDEIETSKKKLPLNNKKTFYDITDDSIATLERIKDIITLANGKLEQLRNEHEALNKEKGEAEQIIAQIKEKKGSMKELEEEEDRQKESVIIQIKSELQQIEENVSKLKQYMDLKEKENKDLEISEEAFEALSCDNKKEYIKKRDETKEKMESALKSLFGNEKIEKWYKETPSYVSEKKILNYMIYDLDTVSSTLLELKQKSTEIDRVISESETIMTTEVTPVITQFTELKNSTMKETFKDLLKMMKNSFESFKSTVNSISEHMDEYERRKEKLENCKENIEKMKNKFFSKLVEEDTDAQEERDIYQETLDVEKFIRDNESKITEKIRNGKDALSTFKKQFEIYNEIQKDFNIIKDDQISNELKGVKVEIEKVKADDTINDYETKYGTVIHLLNDKIRNIKLSKNKIDNAKILNKIINESNKKCESIRDFKGKMEELKESINKHSRSINDDNLIEDNIKQRLSGNLMEKERIMEECTRTINELDVKSNEILNFFTKLKETIRTSSTEAEITNCSEGMSSKQRDKDHITTEIDTLSKRITTLIVEVDTLINSHNNEIADIIYGLVTELNQEINRNIDISLGSLEETKKSFEGYDMDADIIDVQKDDNKEKLRRLCENFSTFKDNISEYKESFIKIQGKSKSEVGESDNIKKITENLHDKRRNMKKNYEKMKKTLEALREEEQKLTISLSHMTEKKKEYKITLIIDYHDQMVEEKGKGEEELATINQCKEKIDELKKNVPDATGCELENFNYENYVNNAKENQKEINRLEQEVSAIKEDISSDKTEKEIDALQIKVKTSLKEAIREKIKIDNESKSIKHMEQMLMLKKFSIIMQDIRSNVQQAKEEKENAGNEFTKSENMKEKVRNDLQTAEKLSNLLMHNLDETSMDNDIEKIRLLNNNIELNTKCINGFLEESKKHNEASKLCFKNITRGKDKIRYLKNHDQEEEKKITEEELEDVDRHVLESENYSKEAAKYEKDTNENYKSSEEYSKRMNIVLIDSLIFAEKIKVSIKKNNVMDIFLEMQDEYYDNEHLVEKLKERLFTLIEENCHMKSEYEANNDKSMEAFTRIQTTRTKASSTITDIENIQKRTLKIVNVCETELESASKEPEESYDNPLNELKNEQENLRNFSKLLKEFDDKRKYIKIELGNLKVIKTKVDSMEDEMEISKRLYEEGILEEIKKIADEEKKIIEFLKESMENTIDTSIAFMKDSALGSEIIIQKFDEPKISMNEKYDSFDKSYKEIEKEARNILETSNTYKSMKEKKKRAKIEKIKLEELNMEMNQLLNSMKYIKTKEILRLIVYMKKELDKVYGIAQEEHIIMQELTEGIRKNVENTINATGVDTALNELDDAKNKFNAFKKSKITHTSYRYNAYSIYVDIKKDMEFIDMDIKTIAALHGYEDMENVEEILLIIQGDSHDIDNKERENEENIMYIKVLYEQVRVRENIKKNIKDKINEINALLQDAQDSLSSYKKIKEINVDINDYGKNVKNSKQYENFIKKSSSYEKTYNKMKIDLKIEEIKSELNTSKKTLNDLEELIEGANVVEFTSKILERAKENISTVIDKINKANNNILGIHASLTELIELRRKCKLYFLHLVITSINTKITKDAILFEKRKKNIIELMEYVIYTYDSINKDIDMTNKCFSKRMIKSYDSNNVDSLNKLVEDFKRRELKVMERISDIKKAFVESNKRRDSIYIDESLHKLKHVYNEFKKEKKYLNKIYKKMSEIELKERDNSAAKYIYISESYEQLIEKERKKILDNKSKLEEMESFIRKDSQKLLSMEHIDTNEKNTQKFKASYEAIMNKVKNIEKLENKNNKAKIKLTNHFPQICYLIDRTKGLLKETELYEHEIDYDLSKKENMEILYEVHNYIKSTEIKIEESKRILEELRNRIEQNKQYVHENDITIHSIYYMLSKVNNIKENYKIEIEENKERNPNEINTIKNKKSVINNNIDNYFKFDMMNNVSLEKNKFGNSKFKLTVGILIGLLIFYVGVMLIIHKKKNMKKEVTKEICKEYEESKNVRDLDKKEVIDVSFFGQ